MKRAWMWGGAAAVTLGAGVPVTLAFAQDATASESPAAPTVDQSWASVREAYGAVPTGDRVTVTVAGADGATKGSESFEIRIDPRPGNAAGPRVRLDLGRIRLVAGDGRLVGVHTLSREGAFVADGVGEKGTPAGPTINALRSFMPPLPLPALAALTDGMTDAAGYVRPIEWREVVVEAGGTRSILGRASSGPESGVTARLTLASSGRVRSLTLGPIPGGGSITAAFAELPSAPTPADFDLGADGWKRVRTIRELFQLPQTPVDPGQQAPELAAQAPAGEPIVLNDALAKVTPARVTRADGGIDIEQEPPAAERIVLILHRLPAEVAACGVPSSSLTAARAALADVLYRSQRDRFLSRAVAGGEGDKSRLAPTSGAIVLVADLGEGNAPARLEQGGRAAASGDLPRAHASVAPAVFEAASIAGVIGPFAAHTEPGETLLVTLTREWRLIKAEPWPAGMSAAQGATHLEKRLRGE